MIKRKWLVTIIVCAGVFMSSLDLFIVNIAFPSISRAFDGASLSSLSWVLNGYSIVFAALLVPAGRWADAFGRRRAFLLGLVVFAAASAGCALAPSVDALVAARIVQAAGGALMLPTSLGLILPEFDASERPAAIGAWAATGAIAAASGPPLGGLLVQADWRLVFLVNIPVAIVALVAGRRVLIERREDGALRPDLLSAAAFTVAITALVLAIVKGPTWGWTSAAVLVPACVSIGLLAAIWRRSQHHRSPLIDPAMLRVRSFSLAAAASVLFFAGFGAMLLNGVLFLTGVWHETVLEAGLMLFPGPLMAAVFRFVGPGDEQPALVDWHVQRRSAAGQCLAEPQQAVVERRLVGAVGRGQPAGSFGFGDARLRGDLVLDLGEAGLPVGGLAHGQQIAALGVEQEQQPVKQRERGLVGVVQLLVAGRAVDAQPAFVVFEKPPGQVREDGGDDAFLQPLAQLFGVVAATHGRKRKWRKRKWDGEWNEVPPPFTFPPSAGYTSPQRFRKYHCNPISATTVRKKAQVSQKVFFVSCCTSSCEVFSVSSRITSFRASGALDLPPVMAARLRSVSASAAALSNSRSWRMTRNRARAEPSGLSLASAVTSMA